MGQVWIIDRSHAQLGNRLIFVASVYAWCLEHGHTLRYPSFHRYAHLFPSFERRWWGDPAAEPNCPLSRPNLVRFQKAAVLALRGLSRLGLFTGRLRPPTGVDVALLAPSDAAFPPPGRGRYVLFSWRFSNPEGLRKHRAKILELLRPQPGVSEDARAFAGALPPGRLRIGVHIRHRDYRLFKGGKFFIPIEGYREQMARLRERYASHRPVFVIFSDEPRRAEEFDGFDVHLSGGTMIQDLHRMAGCDVIVGPPSTFNVWAAYVGGGITLHIGPAASEEGMDWNYRGLPVTQDLASVDEHLAGARPLA
jgi:hypothetical protein